MLVKTSELQGAALDWAVAKCEGQLEFTDMAYIERYTTDWTQGGPIIEWEKVNLKQGVGVLPAAFILISGQSIKWFSGETPLIAAMRCYVASKLGEEVDIPEGL